MSDHDKEKLVQQLKDALVAIRKLKSDLNTERQRNKEPLAIIGMAMRFPGGVRNAEDYWALLEEGRDAITDIPPERFNARQLYDPELSTAGKINVLQGGFIDEVDRFDSSFFDITPVEIESMDPQQRILLELAHEAMENAGLNVQELVGSNTGVYIGIGSNDYQVRHFHSGDYRLVNPYSYTGSAGCAVAGRISYMMGLQGPSMSIDTACSASIVAAHVGSRALRNRECDMALIGGVNLMLSPEMTICFSNLQALSPDARCKTFDNSANGYVRSEGSGVLVLKRLSDARRDGDPVLAVIKGSASNQDGRSNGFTAPNVKAQIDLLRKALEDAGLTPADIDYIEAHGTGTRIGDPIEVEALASVFSDGRTKDDPLIVGSVKSNVGHLESAAGMASMVKAVLSLQHKSIPKSIHFKEPNELIDWDRIPIRIPTGLTPFEKAGRNIGISGFGITGTNGHIIIGDAPATEPAEVESPEGPSLVNTELLLLPLSARSPEALSALAGRYAGFMETSGHSPKDICAFTAQKRAQFDLRKLFVARDSEALVGQLKEYASAAPSATRKFDPDDILRKVFVFTGQGAQWAGMGMKLAESDPVFRKALESVNEALSSYVDWDVFEELGKDEESTRLKEGDVMQPLLMAIGVALARWWMSRGILPDAVVGHSMGEVAAAHIAGHITLDEAARIITSRSRLMEAQAGKGMMLATDLSVPDAEKCIAVYDGRLSVSVLNSPSTTVIGGDTEAIDELMTVLESEDRWCRKVKMTVAAHTAQMDPVLEPLSAELSGLKPQDGPVDLYSSSQDRMVKGSELDAGYWVKNVRNTVKFGAAVQALGADENTVFIEIGPHSVLAAAIEENMIAAGRSGETAVVSSFYRNKDEVVDLHRNLGDAYALGLAVDWAVTHDKPSTFIQLPNYPWQRERFWYDEVPEARSAVSAAASTAGSFYTSTWKADDVHEKSVRKILLINGSASAGDALKAYGHHVETADAGSLPENGHSFDSIIFEVAGGSDWLDACLDLQTTVRLISESGWSSVPRFSILTSGVYPNAEESTATPTMPDRAGAFVWGMVRTLRNEYPELKGIAVDTDDPASSAVAELFAGATAGEYRIYENSPETARVEAYSPPSVTSEPIAPGACFLVTGGTSGLGLAFAEWLADIGVSKIALVSRSGEKPETAESVARMKASGAEVKIFKADIGDAAGVSELIGSVEVSLSRITGVVHAAGLVDDGTISSLERSQFERVSLPKIDGTLNLHNALKDNELSHFIVFSSAAAVLGTVGQANYNGANLYLDRLMEWRSRQGLAATSVAWGNIGDVGMAAAESIRGDRFEAMGFYPIGKGEFSQYFKAVFQVGDPCIIAMKMDFEKWAARHPAMTADPVFQEVLAGSKPAKELTAASGWGNSIAVARKKLGEMIRTHLSAITGIAGQKVREDETFKSMGLDSMMALQLRNRIQESVGQGKALPVTSIWSHPTVEKYAGFLIEELDLEARLSGGADTEPAVLTEHQLRELVRNSVSGITRIPPNRIREQDTFKSMGIDSMQALQIRNALQEETGTVLAASSIWAHPTVEKYAAFLLAQLGGGDKEPEIRTAEAPASGKPSDVSVEAEVEDLSLDELMKQLEDKSREY